MNRDQERICDSYVKKKWKNNNLVKLEIKLSLETENYCDIIINTTLSLSFQIEKRKDVNSTQDFRI